jgi:hypothetical protein
LREGGAVALCVALCVDAVTEGRVGDGYGPPSSASGGDGRCIASARVILIACSTPARRALACVATRRWSAHGTGYQRELQQAALVRAVPVSTTSTASLTLLQATLSE